MAVSEHVMSFAGAAGVAAALVCVVGGVIAVAGDVVGIVVGAGVFLGAGEAAAGAGDKLKPGSAISGVFMGATIGLAVWQFGGPGAEVPTVQTPGQNIAACQFLSGSDLAKAVPQYQTLCEKHGYTLKPQ